MMKTPTRIISGSMILIMTLMIAGCSADKADISKERVCEAYDNYGAQKVDKFDDFSENLNFYSLGAEGSYYYASQDEDELKYLVKNIMFRFQDIPDWDCQETTYFISASKEDDSKAGSYILICKNETDAANVFDYVSEDMSDDDNYVSGTKSGVSYAVSHEESTKKEMEGVYRQGNSVFWIRAFASETDGLKEYEKIIKDMGLVSPLSE